MLYADLKLPDDVRDAMVAEIDRIPIGTFKKLLEYEPEFARGFRPDPKNLPAFRKRLREKFLSDSTVLTKDEVWALRDYGVNMEIVCVFSVLALTSGFNALAGFLGGARLVAGMLVDQRPEVVEAARQILAKGEPLPEPPADPEAARANLERSFGPFVKALSRALVAPVVKQIVKEERPAAGQPAEAVLRDVAKLAKKFAKTDAALAEANRRIGELVREGARKDALLVAVKKERTAATEAAKEAKREAKSAKKKARQATPKAEAAEAALAAAEKRAEEAEKRAQAAEEALAAALAAVEPTEPREGETDAVLEEVGFETVSSEQPKPIPEPPAREAAPARESAPADTAHAKLDAFLNATMPPAKPVRIGPESVLSRFYPHAYRREDEIVFLIDGHNIMNLNYPELSKDRTNGLSHNEVRYRFVGECKKLALGFPNSKTRVFFDGNEGRVRAITRNLVVEYSGNPQKVDEHRADMAIVDHVAFLAFQNDVPAWAVFVVSSDQGLCEKAREYGALTIGHERFADIMAACK